MLNSDSLNALSRIAFDSVQRAVSNQHCRHGQSEKKECTSWRSNGFSDSAIYRLTTDAGDFAIRSWPSRFDTPTKVAFWSSTNKLFLGTTSGLVADGAINPTPFPKLFEWHGNGSSPSHLLPFADKLWTLCEWVAGKPIETSGVTKSTIQHLATILARIHAQSSIAQQSSNTPVGKSTMRSNSLRERLEILKSIDYRLLSSCDPTHFFENNQLLERITHGLAIVLERQPSWLRFLSICESQNRECHWIVRDLWSENILVDEHQRFSSIVDLGASRLDWPGLDFVRLFGSLSYTTKDRSVLTHDASQAGHWDDAYLSYIQMHSGHAIASLDECRMLHKVSLGLSIVQWILWNKTGNIDLNNSDKAQRVATRIASLCEQLLIEAT